MKILVIQGSPDAGSYSHELATAYADEARSAGHDVRTIDLWPGPNTSCSASRFGGLLNRRF